MLLEVFREVVAEGARAAHLHVAVAVLLAAGELRADGDARLVADALRDGDDAASELLHGGLDVRDEAVEGERTLRQVDEVRAVVPAHAREGRGGGEEARVAAHDDVDLHAAERAVVEVVALEGACDEAGGGTEARRVVAAAQVVVDCLGDVVADERVAVPLRLLRDDARGVRRVVAADVEEETHLEALER